MENQLYKLRCLKNGILVTSEPDKYNVVWKREFNPMIYSEDNKKYKQDCECMEATPFVNEDNNYHPYCRWCGNDFKLM